MTRKRFLCILLLLFLAGSMLYGYSNTDDYLHTSGNKIVDNNGDEVWLTGVNWFGYEESEKVFHGLWSRDMKDTFDLIADLGFNLVRVPIHARLVYEWANGVYPDPQTISASNGMNEYLDGLNTLQVMDVAVDYCGRIGMKIMFDMHSIDPHGYMDEGVWYLDDFPFSNFITAWEFLADHYKDTDVVIAADLSNEPHDASSGNARWTGNGEANDWKSASEQLAAAILAINPDLLIVVEGIQSYYDPTETNIHIELGVDLPAGADPDWHSTWWGGNLMGVDEYPLDLGSNQDKLVYSPHDYGPAVFRQSWFKINFTYNTMLQVWGKYWLFVHDENTAPLLIGEWGGLMSNADNLRWMNMLRDLIIDKGIHHTFWCLNPNSGDTGGIFADASWTDINTAKYNLVKPALWAEDDGRFIGLDHERILGESGSSVTLHYGGSLPTPGPTLPPEETLMLSVLYKCTETNDMAAQVKPQIQVKSSGNQDVDLTDITLRYYYTNEGSGEELFSIDYAVLGTENVTGAFGDGYVEISFTAGAGILSSGGNTGDIQARLNKDDWTEYDQTNDYSFDPAKTDFEEWDRITIYYKGTLVFGTPPEGQPTDPPVTDPPPSDSPGPCPLTGDVNDSGVVDIVDALMAAQFYVGLVPANFNELCADVNGDGNVNIVDALMIAQYYVGLIDTLG